MVQIEIIGNLGSDVKRVEYQGAEFYTFNICDNRKVNGQEKSMWYGCTLNRASNDLLQFLVKGQGVFVRGIPRYRIFDSAQHHCKMVAVDVMVNEIQLVGGSPASRTQDPAAIIKSEAIDSMLATISSDLAKTKKVEGLFNALDAAAKALSDLNANSQQQQQQGEQQDDQQQQQDDAQVY